MAPIKEVLRQIGTAVTIAISFLIAIASYVITILTVTPGGTTGYHQYDVPLSETFTDRSIILHNNNDVTWNLARVALVSTIEIFLGICIACTTDISKFIRMYKGKFKEMCSALVYCSCFRHLDNFRRTRWLKKPEADSSGDEKSELEVEHVVKPVKLYPDLDISETPPGPGSNNSEPPRPASKNEMLRRAALAPGLWLYGERNSMKSSK
ncbi:hypothetical protein NHQ30_008818 [Ciborinia camelliae]|nr:hypothetical protein NHQ30_008818 [Ciborinia camelliae]